MKFSSDLPPSQSSGSASRDRLFSDMLFWVLYAGEPSTKKVELEQIILRHGGDLAHRLPNNDTDDRDFIVVSQRATRAFFQNLSQNALKSIGSRLSDSEDV